MSMTKQERERRLPNTECQLLGVSSPGSSSGHLPPGRREKAGFSGQPSSVCVILPATGKKEKWPSKHMPAGRGVAQGGVHKCIWPYAHSLTERGGGGVCLRHYFLAGQCSQIWAISLIFGLFVSKRKWKNDRGLLLGLCSHCRCPQNISSINRNSILLI